MSNIPLLARRLQHHRSRLSLWAGGVAGSSDLIGFGLDSVIEVASAVALSWQFSAKGPERREHLILRIIAVSSAAPSRAPQPHPTRKRTTAALRRPGTRLTGFIPGTALEHDGG